MVSVVRQKRKKPIPEWVQAQLTIRAEMDALPADQVVRVACLVKWAGVVRTVPDAHTLAERRDTFRRANRRGRSLVGQCWACSATAVVFTHHIVQLQHGGWNHQRNLVRICGPCHAAIHPWLGAH